MVCPTLVGIAVFALWPIVQSAYLSFTTWDGFGQHSWSGLDNYGRLLHDPQVAYALRNSLIYAFVGVPLTIAIATGVAVLLNQQIRGVWLYRLMYFLPVVTMPAAAAMVWRWMFNGDYGLITATLAPIGIVGPQWLTDPRTAILAVIIVIVWSDIGINLVILLSGLQGISRTYYEAAALDGAGAFRRFVSITLPLLSPTLFFVFVTAMISIFQIFDVIYLMVGPQGLRIDETRSLVELFYEQGFQNGNKGYAAAIIMVLFLIILAGTAIQFSLQRRWVHYDQ